MKQAPMKLITESIEDVEYLTEDIGEGKKTHYIKGTFLMSEIANRNRRMYSRSILENEVARYRKEYVNTNRAFGELGHPDNPNIHLDRVSHLITSLEQDGNNFYGKAKILDTPMGNIVKGIMDGGGKLGVSSRGMGTLKAGSNGINMVQDDYTIATAADIVADPSASHAFVEGIMEGKEWVFVNGHFIEEDIQRTKTVIQKASRRDLETISLALFANFLQKL